MCPAPPDARPDPVTRPRGAGRLSASRAGGIVVRPAAIADWGGTPGAFAEPDGYVWEVAHNPDWTLALIRQAQVGETPGGSGTPKAFRMKLMVQ